MFLKMYLADLFVDKVEVDFSEMDTTKAKQRYLEKLAEELAEENKTEIIASEASPKFYIQLQSSMSQPWFQDQTWKQIIQTIGSKKAKENFEELSQQLAHEKIKEANE